MVANTCYFIPTEEKWFCGLLNAQAVEWFYEQIANRIQGGYLRAFTERIFSNSRPIYAMLFDMQALDLVRIIEERD